MQKLFSLDGKVVRILTFLTDLIILNTLFIVSCIPIVTIGASLTSLTTMWYRILKGKDTDIAYHYFRIFRQNFKQSTFILVVYPPNRITFICELLSLGLFKFIFRV